MNFFPNWTYPFPLMRIFIRDLILPARIGVYDYEHHQLQRLKINISVGVEDHKKIGIDDLCRTVSYENIVNHVKEIVSRTNFYLVETLVETLIETVMCDTRIVVTRVSVEKLDIIEEASGVGVEIERWREA